MKYVTPKYERSDVKTEDILTASSGFEITKTSLDEGKIQLEFSKLFGR